MNTDIHQVVFPHSFHNAIYFSFLSIHATQVLKSEKGEKKRGIEQLIQSIEKEAKKLNLSLASVTKSMKERQKKVNCPTFHGAGMVVPVDDNEVGYRPVPETQSKFRLLDLNALAYFFI